MIVVWLFVAMVVATFLGVIIFGSPYVPSQRRDINRAFTKLYPLSKKDTLVDLGSGDGIVLRVAASYGASAIGIELNPFLVGIAQLLSRRDKNISITIGDLRSMRLPDNVTVVYSFPNTKDIGSLTKKLQSEAVRLKHDFYLISYGAQFPGLMLEKTEGAHLLYNVTSQDNTLTL